MIQNLLRETSDNKILIHTIHLVGCKLNQNTFAPITRLIRFVESIDVSGNHESVNKLIEDELRHSMAPFHLEKITLTLYSDDSLECSREMLKDVIKNDCDFEDTYDEKCRDYNVASGEESDGENKIIDLSTYSNNQIDRLQFNTKISKISYQISKNKI